MDDARAAFQRWLKCPRNTPEEVEAWVALYTLLVPRPEGSRNATLEDLEPVILP